MRSSRSFSTLPARGSLMTNRHMWRAIASRLASRRLVFPVAVISILSAKCVHIYAHINALPTAKMVKWGLSFFAQDTVLLLVLRLFLDFESPPLVAVGCLRPSMTIVGCCVALSQLILAAINISFFILTGSELHWRNVGLAADSSSWPMLFTGVVSFSVILTAIIVAGWFLQDVCFALAGMAVDAVVLPFRLLFDKLRRRRCSENADMEYDRIPQKELNSDEEEGNFGGTTILSEPSAAIRVRSRSSRLARALIGISLALQFILSLARPSEGSLSFMSWTPILLPIVDFIHSSAVLTDIDPHNSDSPDWWRNDLTALAEPIRWGWLSRLEASLPGFEDWSEPNKDHYDAAKDPLKIANLEDDLLPALRGKLGAVDIRHIVLIKMESTRKDVFPIKKDGLIWKKLAEAWPDGVLSQAAQDRFATLTPNANLLTGDYNDGFKHNDSARRGGISVNNDHTTSTYTLKSLTGTLCGITPLVADLNVEYQYHIYQPCLPQIFNALNSLNRAGGNSADANDGYNGYKWSNSFMMSVTNTYDKQDLLMPRLGYDDSELITKEYLQSDQAKFGKATLPDINYYGMRESVVEDYIRDAFQTAKERSERVFLTHLTSTAHHPFEMPSEEAYVPLAPQDKLKDLSHYVNAVGFVDRWLGRIFEVLDEQGVSNETLVVVVGDHGLPVAETGAVTPYYQPHIGAFHVPIVMSHPGLPPINIDKAANSVSILPTILDLLVETGSLSRSGREAARDLARNYEGQSFLRPLQDKSRETGNADWQFTVMNTGRAQVAVRSPLNPQWRLVVPVVSDMEWRFTSVEADPHEEAPILSFDFEALVLAVGDMNGAEAAKWVREAVSVTRWWIGENAKRWRYSP